MLKATLSRNFLIWFFSFLFFSFASFLFLFLKEGNGRAYSENQIRVIFSSPLSFQEFSDFLDSYEVSPTELHYSYGEIQGGYTIDSEKNLQEELTRFQEKHEKFLSLMIEKTENEKKNAQENDTFHRNSKLLQELQSAEEKSKTEGILLDWFDANIQDKEIGEEMEQDLRVKEIKSEKEENILSQMNEYNFLQSAKDFFFGKASASLYHEDWAPYGGGSDVNQSYTYQTFYFNDTSDFGSTNTYEHETQVYDNDFADYDDYWSSNMPDAYYDTAFLDDIDNFTIGSLIGDDLETNTEYYTYMELEGETAPTATVRIKGQLGHRYPSWCYSTWCVYADATTSSMAMFTAPSGMSWQY